jgi:hypothetical protein
LSVAMSMCVVRHLNLKTAFPQSRSVAVLQTGRY